jgi:hypothetical protein
VYEAGQQIADIFNTEANPETKLRNLGYALGMLTGIPARNLNNYGTMILKRICPDVAYDWEIKSNGYSLYNKEAINSALNNNQISKAWNYYKAYTNNIFELDEETTKALYELYSKGYKDAYVKQIPLIIEGEDETITVDRDKFVNTYSELATSLKHLISSSSFKNLSDGKKEKMIKKLVDYHYSIAYKEQSGEKLKALELIIRDGYVPINHLITLREISLIEGTYKHTRSELVKKYINNLRISLAEKYLLFYLSGYKIKGNQVSMVKELLKSRGVSYLSLREMFDK